MYQPLIKFHPHPAIITQVLTIFVKKGTPPAAIWETYSMPVKNLSKALHPAT